MDETEKGAPVPGFVSHEGSEASQPARETLPHEQTPEGRDASELAALNRLFPQGGEDDDGLEDYPMPPGHVSPVDVSPGAEYVQRVLERERAAETAAPASPQESREAPTQDQPDDDAYRLAAAELRRDGLSTDDIAVLPRERVIALGEKRRKVHVDTDSAYEELVQLRERGAARENEARRGENEAEASPAGVDFSALAQSLGGDEGTAKALADLVRQAQAPLLAELAQTRQAVGAEAQRRAFEPAWAGLEERYPEILKAPGAKERVLGLMDRFEAQGHTGSVAEKVEDAFLVGFAGEIKAAAAKRTQTLRTARANGQMTSSATRERPQAPKKLTRDDIERAAFDALFDTSIPDREGRLRAARRATLGEE